MPTRNDVITDQQAAFIDRVDKAGRYKNAREALREGLALVEPREAEDVARLKALLEAVQLGIDEIEAGKYTEFESVDAWIADFDALCAQIIAEEQNSTAT